LTVGGSDEGTGKGSDSIPCNACKEGHNGYTPKSLVGYAVAHYTFEEKIAAVYKP